ncbi:MAG TPA: hypothetical protein PLF13_03520 [candidate division Zixibacteria bacterium]|nr:hypothetical protein [candidate division Zixibacteria bacterium]
MRKFLIGFAIGIALWFVIELFRPMDSGDTADTVVPDTTITTDTTSPKFVSDEAESARLDYINSLKDDSTARLAPIWDSNFAGAEGIADSVSMEIKFRESDSIWEKNQRRYEAGEE